MKTILYAACFLLLGWLTCSIMNWEAGFFPIILVGAGLSINIAGLILAVCKMITGSYCGFLLLVMIVLVSLLAFSTGMWVVFYLSLVGILTSN